MLIWISQINGLVKEFAYPLTGWQERLPTCRAILPGDLRNTRDVMQGKQLDLKKFPIFINP
jgi:hypothetical protein